MHECPRLPTVWTPSVELRRAGSNRTGVAKVYGRGTILRRSALIGACIAEAVFIAGLLGQPFRAFLHVRIACDFAARVRVPQRFSC
jgi:hypothetical protein